MVSTRYRIAEAYQQQFIHLKQNEHDSPLRQIDIKKSYTHPFTFHVWKVQEGIRDVYGCIILAFPQLNKRMVYTHYILGEGTVQFVISF
ncbi:MAG: hypothetical protein QM671_27400 [Bacillus sp. (in: firmicutes)]|uniref:hypothetical protein n=1 Tax=Bacillus sp. TaxID=1409 RepID=UPI0039E669EA